MNYKLSLLILLVFASCTEKIHNKDEALVWLKSNADFITEVKEVNGIKLKLTYLPAEYLSYMESNNREEYDSLLGFYDNGINFLFEIAPLVENEKGDIMLQDIYSIEEYKQRFIDLNFDLSSYMRLETNSREYYPVLCIMENTYGLSPGRKFNLAFSTEELEEKTQKTENLEIIFEDIFFETGINHFLFNLDELPEFPEIKFSKYNENE